MRATRLRCFFASSSLAFSSLTLLDPFGEVVSAAAEAGFTDAFALHGRLRVFGISRRSSWHAQERQMGHTSFLCIKKPPDNSRDTGRSVNFMAYKAWQREHAQKELVCGLFALHHRMCAAMNGLKTSLDGDRGCGFRPVVQEDPICVVCHKRPFVSDYGIQCRECYDSAVKAAAPAVKKRKSDDDLGSGCLPEPAPSTESSGDGPPFTQPDPLPPPKKAIAREEVSPKRDGTSCGFIPGTLAYVCYCGIITKCK
jgi:hypothetical protein